VPVLFTVWGGLCWFVGVRKLFRDPRRAIREIAEARARSRLLHPFGKGDVETEFRQQWRMRWVGYVAIVGYTACVCGAWLHVIVCWLAG
jgi:hypothetical protein